MAIEFLCPHCRTRMRTPDETIRRELDCPKCRGRLRVPVVEIGNAPVPVEVVEPVAASAASDPFDLAAAPSGVPPADPPRFDPLADATPAAADSEGLDFLTGSAPSSSSTPILRRKKKTPWGLWLTIAAGLAVIGGVYFTVGQPTAPLVGSLTATVASGGPHSATVPFPASVTPTDREALIAELQRQPVRLGSASVDVEVRAGQSGLEYTVTPAEGTQVLLVDPSTDPALAEYLAANAATLDAARTAGRDRAITQMFADLFGEELRPGAVAGYLDSVFLSGLQDGLGAAAVANVGGTAVPVMHSDQTMAFAVQPGVSLFELVRRPNTDGLPPDFRYQVSVQ